MWECPQCKTMNKRDKCVLCGEPNPFFPKVILEKKKSAGGRNGRVNINEADIQKVIREVDEMNSGAKSGTSATQQTIPVGNIKGVKKTSSVPMKIRQIKPENQNYVEEVSDSDNLQTEKSKSKKWVVVLIIILLFALAASVVGFCEFQRDRAKKAFDAKNFETAKNIYGSIAFYRNSEMMMKECDYQSAVILLKKGKITEAKAIFEELSDYGDAKEQLMECDYQTALQMADSFELISAYDCLKRLADDDYKDSKSRLLLLIDDIYDEGVICYKSDEYESAREHFEKYEEGCQSLGMTVVSDYADYLKLIEARLTELEDITALYDLIDFEDTKDILLTEKYMSKFLMGKWLDSSNNTIEIKDEGGIVKIICTLPFVTEGEYRFSDGIQYQGSEENGWTESLRYEIIHKNKIKVYCYADGIVYTMYRQ